MSGSEIVISLEWPSLNDPTRRALNGGLERPTTSRCAEIFVFSGPTRKVTSADWVSWDNSSQKEVAESDRFTLVISTWDSSGSRTFRFLAFLLMKTPESFWSEKKEFVFGFCCFSPIFSFVVWSCFFHFIIWIKERPKEVVSGVFEGNVIFSNHSKKKH